MTSKHGRIRRLVALLVAPIVLACACGSSGPSLTPRQIARAAVLRPADLPERWDAVEHDPRDDDYTKMAKQFASCLESTDPIVPPSAVVAHSPDFSSGGGALQAKSAIAVTSARRVRASVDNFGENQAPSCMSASIRDALGKAELGDITVESIDTNRLRLSGLDVPAARLRSTLHLRINDAALTVYVDNVVLGHDRLLAILYFVGTRQPLDADLEMSLIRTVAKRMAKG